MKVVLSKVSDCLFNVAVGCILVSLFDDYSYSIIVALISAICAIALTLKVQKMQEV